MVPIFNKEAENCRVEVEYLGRAFETIFMESNDVQPKGAKPQLCKEVVGWSWHLHGGYSAVWSWLEGSGPLLGQPTLQAWC